jgi:lysylphosphatidylglycerol synthetase-like protein (DUF2156 family)
VERLRRAVVVTVAVLAAVFGALALLFGVVLEPGEDLEGCSTGLHPGPYADAIVPAHLAAFAALALLVGWLSAQRRPTGRPGRGTLVVLSAIAVFALAATVRHELMDWPALLGLIVVIPVGALTAVAALVNTALVLRSRQPPERGWERHVRLAQLAAWLALLIGLPAMLAGAWTNGAGLFCF